MNALTCGPLSLYTKVLQTQKCCKNHQQKGEGITLQWKVTTAKSQSECASAVMFGVNIVRFASNYRLPLLLTSVPACDEQTIIARLNHTPL